MASTYVVDTGVYLRWFVDQGRFEHARELQRSLITGTAMVETVDFARIEVAGVRARTPSADRRTVGEFTAAVQVIDDLGVTVHTTTADLLERAASLAARKNLGMYDALFIEPAEESGLPLLTTDVKLSHAAHGIVPIEVLQGVEKPA